MKLHYLLVGVDEIVADATVGVAVVVGVVDSINVISIVVLTT